MFGRKRKQGEDQPPAFRGEFSFVNKDAGNIDSKDHSAAVSWHVLNRYERWKKQEQAKRLRSTSSLSISQTSSAPPPPPLSSQVSSEVRRFPLRPPNPAAAFNPLTFIPQQSAQTSSAFVPNPWTFDDLAQQSVQVGGTLTEPSSSQVRTPASSMSTPSIPSAMLTDEYFTTSGPGTAAYQTPTFDPNPPQYHLLFPSLVSFAYEYMIPKAWPTDVGQAEGMYGRSKAFEDLPTVQSDICYSRASLALFATVMATILEDDSLTSQARSFAAQAMGELRQRISQQTGNHSLGTLKAILRLFSAETAVDNTAIARSHLKMLRRMVAASGGIILLDPWFREELLSCDCYFALKYDTRPLFPASEWTPGPLSAPWRARLIRAGVLGEHAAKTDSSIDHQSLKSLLTDLRELFETEEYVNNQNIQYDDQLLRWRRLRLLDCISRIAEHNLNVTLYAHLYADPKTQAYTCKAIALMTALVCGTPEPVRFGLKMINELRQKMTDAEVHQTLPSVDMDSKLKLWAYYVGSLGEKTHPVPEQDQWFGSKFEEQASKMQLLDWKAIKNILRNFLFSARLHDEIEGGRAHRTVERRKGLYDISNTSWREPLELTPQPGYPEESTYEEEPQGKGKAREA